MLLLSFPSAMGVFVTHCVQETELVIKNNTYEIIHESQKKKQSLDVAYDLKIAVYFCLLKRRTKTEYNSRFLCTQKVYSIYAHVFLDSLKLSKMIMAVVLHHVRRLISETYFPK